MTDLDLALMSATGLLEAFRQRAVSPVELTEANLAQIGEYDTEFNAWCLVDADSALHEARRSERRYLNDEPSGPLDGLTVAVKDVLLTRGWPTRRGSKTIAENQPWLEDAPTVEAVRAAGGILLGKVTTPEFAWKGVTDSPLYGVTRNPWNVDTTPGGSSGGSSVAVTLGMTSLALGTDGGGSIRIPSSFCGHPGLKPTYGRVPAWPSSPFGTLAHVGPMARTVSDLTLLLETLMQPDPRDWEALPSGGPDHLSNLASNLDLCRVAYSPRLGYATVDPEVEALVSRAVQAFASSYPVSIEQVDPGFANPRRTFQTLWSAGTAQVLRHIQKQELGQLDPGLVEIAAEGAQLTLDAYMDAVQQRAELARTMSRFHERYDILITPTVAVPAFAAPGNTPPGWPADEGWPDWTPFTYPFNLSQQPALSIACGRTLRGLPVGLQIVGPRYSDRLLLMFASRFEEMLPAIGLPDILVA